MASSKSRLPTGYTAREVNKMLKELIILLEITTDDEDVIKNIHLKMLAVIGYLSNGGASKDSIKSILGMTCISLGVNDLMERKAGDIKFSPAFDVLSCQITRG